jgi:hypothetical protein
MTGESIFEHPCGGANRIWEFYVPSLGNVDIYDFTKRVWLVYASKAEV